MAALSSTFLDCSSLACSQRSSSLPSRKSPLLVVSAQNKTDEERLVRHRKAKEAKAPPSSSWISFFLFSSSPNSLTKPLLEDAGTEPAGSIEASSANAQTDHVKMPSKKGPKGTKRVSFTPQKARELRQKLKDSDNFHDVMYHSTIASRLASRDN